VSATAEHCFGLLLALLRHTPAATAHVLAGGWDRDQFWGTQLKGKCLGVIGYGRIGAMVARYAASFGMEVFACDRVADKIGPPAKPVSFDELLRHADVVSVHVTATPENRNLIDRAAIARLKQGAILVNTARGSLVDEAALAEAVRRGQLLGVAVDVLAGEGYGEVSESPLLEAAREGRNILITPHIGGATLESIARTETALVERFLEVLKGEGAAPAEISARQS
jgi:D-3-phosphoglycerate dehydrogenase